MTLSLSKFTRFKSSYDVLGYLLRLLSLIWHRQLNAELAKIGLTEMQFVLLMGLGWIIETKPEGISQTELAEVCGCSTALASQVLKTLALKKLITIENDPRDARARVVKFSKPGEKKLREACVILERTDAEFRRDDPAIFQTLFDALQAAIEVKMQNVAQPGRELGAMPRDIEAPGEPQHDQMRQAAMGAAAAYKRKDRGGPAPPDGDTAKPADALMRALRKSAGGEPARRGLDKLARRKGWPSERA